MVPRNRNLRYKSDRYLVADQPGLTIFFSGLIVALVIGFAIRGLISPSRIKPMIESAASHIHRDLAVRVEAARVSLSDGLFPEFAVVLSEVHMESSYSCWMSPRLFADEMRLPVSLWSLLKGENPVKKIKANEVELRFLTEKVDCGGDVASQLNQVISANDSRKVVSIVQQKNEDIKSYSDADITGIEINRLLVVHEKYPQQNLDLLNLNFEVKSKKPKVFVLKAKTHLMKTNNFGDYVSNANIQIEYKEFPDRNLLAHFFGNWREGHFSLNASYKPDEDHITFDGDLKHIPASQVFGLLLQYGLVQQDYNGKLIWLSLRAHFAGLLKDWKTLPAVINDLNIEGDLGDLTINQIQVQQLEPIKISPFHFDIKNLNIDRLYSLLNKDKLSSAIGKWGYFTGDIDYRDSDNFDLNGDLSGMEFIFSNKGQREKQVVNKISTDVRLKNSIWNIKVDHAEPMTGSFQGNLNLNSDREFKKVDIKLRADELTLNPAVQRLMTQGGKIGPAKTALQMSFQNGVMSSLKGSFSLNDLMIEGVGIEKFQSRIESKNEELLISPSMLNVKVSQSSPIYDFFKPVILKQEIPVADILFKNVSGLLRTKDFKYLKWKTAAVSSPMQLESEGAWVESGEVSGQLKIRSGQRPHSWQLSGHRDHPQLTESLKK